jgi:hypothetical protein
MTSLNTGPEDELDSSTAPGGRWYNNNKKQMQENFDLFLATLSTAANCYARCSNI